MKNAIYLIGTLILINKELYIQYVDEVGCKCSSCDLFNKVRCYDYTCSISIGKVINKGVCELNDLGIDWYNIRFNIDVPNNTGVLNVVKVMNNLDNRSVYKIYLSKINSSLFINSYILYNLFINS
jgi:hypothetical protein